MNMTHDIDMHCLEASLNRLVKLPAIIGKPIKPTQDPDKIVVWAKSKSYLLLKYTLDYSILNR